MLVEKDIRTSVLDRLTIGCSRLGSLHNETPLKENRAMLREAIEVGISSFDTANIYGQGDSERELGKLLRDHPDLMVTTKAGIRHGLIAKAVRLLKPALRPVLAWRGASSGIRHVRSSIDAQDFSPAYLEACVEASRRRLGIARLPGFLLHDPSLEVLEAPATARLLSSLRTHGLVDRVGVSLRDEKTVAAALTIPHLDMLQISMAALEKVRHDGIADEIRSRKIDVHVRQLLSRSDGTRRNIRTAIPDALADPMVRSVVIGISSRKNLDALLQAV